MTQYGIQSAENPGIASTTESAPMSIDPLTGSSNEFTPMTVELLNAVPMGADLVENGSVEYCAQHTDDAPQNTMQQDANHQNQTDSQYNNQELVSLKLPKVRGRKPKYGPRKQLFNIRDICDRLASSVAREEILYCEVIILINVLKNWKI